MKPAHFSDGILGRNKPTVATLAKTHTVVRFITADDLDEVYRQSQGEVWSPNGEARGLLEALGLHHTSMSVGDVIEDVDYGRFYIIAAVGFDPLEG